MATKSINYKLIRFIAFILAALSLFTVGINVCAAVKSEYYYRNYKNRAQTDTEPFRRSMNLLEMSILDAGEQASCENEEDYLKTSYAVKGEKNKNETVNSLTEAFDFLEKSGVEVYVTPENFFRYSYVAQNGVTYYFTYNGDRIDEDEFYDYEFANYPEEDYEEYTRVREDVTKAETATLPAENGPEPASAEIETDAETTAVTSAAVPSTEAPYFYSEGSDVYAVSKALCEVYNATGGLNYGEAPLSGLIAAVERNYVADYTPFENSYEIDRISEFASGFHYAVFYNTTGKVFSDCKVLPGDSDEQIAKKLGEGYKESVINNTFYVNGEEYKAKNGSSTRPALLNKYEQVEKAYFVYDLTKTDDVMAVGRYAFSDFADIMKFDSPNTIFTLLIIFSVIAVLSCAVLVIFAGKEKNGEVKILFSDKTPFAINLALSVALIIGFGGLVYGISYYERNTAELFLYNDFPVYLALFTARNSNVITALLFTLSALILTGLIASVVRNIRNHTFFKHTLIHLVLTPLKSVCRKIKALFHKISESSRQAYNDDYLNGKGKRLIITASIALAAAEILALIMLVLCNGFGIMILFGFIMALCLGAYLLFLVISFNKLARGISKIKSGDLNVNINTDLMPPYMKSVADDISGVRDGVQQAVNQALRDQSMKSELLTNVTHDLKTPLTSVISYVDLLKKEGLDSENAPEYLAVIDEKSQKLKTLIDDLVQASKASSGAIEVNYQTLDLCEFAAQIAGEYKEEFQKSGLDLVASIPEVPVYVSADPALVSRVIENLIGNIKKYSLKNTRAFMVVSGNEQYGTIVFKNVSSEPLNLDLTKLTERFYRGDSARGGEGSGLGLSIAKDLCTLQGGAFRIELDGDMFKTYVSLRSASAQLPAENKTE